MTDTTIRNFPPDTPEDTDVLHINKFSGEDKRVTFEQVSDEILSRVPDEPTFITLGTKTLASGDKFRIEGVGVDTKYRTTLNDLKNYIGNILYPIGITINNQTNPANPSTYLGFGTWVQERGRVLVGEGTGTDINGTSQSFTAGATGGEYTHANTEAENAPHRHQMFSNSIVSGGGIGDLSSTSDYVAKEWELSGNNDQYVMKKDTTPTATGVGGTYSSGLGTPHNNVQPYRVVYMWRRVA